MACSSFRGGAPRLHHLLPALSLWLSSSRSVRYPSSPKAVGLHSCPGSRVKTDRDGTRAETRFGLPAKRTGPFISAGVSVQSSTGFLGVRVGRQRL